MPNAQSARGSRESVFTVLAGLARRQSRGRLATIALLSGAIALIATLLGHVSWILLAACYVTWDFAMWGMIFGPRPAVSRQELALHYFMIVSGAAVFAIAIMGLFFVALGPRWML